MELEESEVYSTWNADKKANEIKNFKTKEIVAKYCFQNTNMIMKIMIEITKIYREFFISEELGLEFAQTLNFVLNKIIGRGLEMQF